MDEQRIKNSRVTMFISLDLVNCTLYKSKNKGNWVYGVGSVLDHIMSTFVHSSVEGYRFWKMLGDEVVYTKEICDMGEISNVVEDVYRNIITINRDIKEAKIGDATTAKILAVKATIWIADISPADMCADNVYIEYEINKNERRMEYLGTDIDAGFRIAQYTSANRVVISSDLAALFLKVEVLKPYLHKIHFLAFRNLKGIWHGEPYPIFMYHGDETCLFADSILDVSNPKAAILKEYMEQAPSRVVEAPYHSYAEQLLTALYAERSLALELTQLTDIIGASKR